MERKLGKIEVYKDKMGLWRFRIKASNNKIIATGEGYASKRNAYRGFRAVLNFVYDGMFSIIEK